MTSVFLTMMATTFLTIPDTTTPPAGWPPAEPLALTPSYELDPFQKQAVLGIHAGEHVFVTAKTGSGKTFVGEYLIAKALAEGKRVFYTTPIKSLSNQKYHDLRRLFPTASIGILTGDIKMCPDADVVVMTAEILRNLFYKRGTATEGVGLTATVSLDRVMGVVMDEVHYIQDADRGHVWEETLVLAPRDLQLVLLSATMPSAEELAAWLGRLHQRTVRLLATTYRIVPLTHAVLDFTGPADGGSDDATAFTPRPLLDAQGRWLSGAYTEWLRIREGARDAARDHRVAVGARRREGYESAVVKRSAATAVLLESPTARLNRVCRWLRAAGHLPATVFKFSRAGCEKAAASLTDTYIDDCQASDVEATIGFHLSRYREQLERSPQYHRLRDLLFRGIAFHHAGLLPILKEIVEILYTRGLVRVLFATETFAVGLNMPTKTVVFLEMTKMSDGGRRALRTDEYLQMAGRAGRRGIDKYGLVFYVPDGEPVPANELHDIVSGSLPALTSRMRFGYEFLLRDRLNDGRLRVAEDSYWATQQRAALEALRRSVVAAEYGCVRMEMELRVDEVEACKEMERLQAAVVDSKGAARKRAHGSLENWKAEHSRGRWSLVFAMWEKIKEASRELERLRGELAAWEALPLVDNRDQERVLADLGFVDEKRELSVMGRAATEIHEGHPLLMSLLAERGACAGLTAAEVATVLACFIREAAMPEDAAPSLNAVGSRPVADVLMAIQGIVDECMAVEDRHKVGTADDYWRLRLDWVLVAERWFAGATLSEIAVELGIYEGVVQRGLLRLDNLLDEWRAVAEVRRDLATLELLNGFRVASDGVIVDSLYLRMK